MLRINLFMILVFVSLKYTIDDKLGVLPAVASTSATNEVIFDVYSKFTTRYKILKLIFLSVTTCQRNLFVFCLYVKFHVSKQLQYPNITSALCRLEILSYKSCQP